MMMILPVLLLKSKAPFFQVSESLSSIVYRISSSHDEGMEETESNFCAKVFVPLEFYGGESWREILEKKNNIPVIRTSSFSSLPFLIRLAYGLMQGKKD